MKKIVRLALLLCLGWVTCAQADLLVAYSFEGDDYTDGSGNGYDGQPGGTGHSFSSDTPVCSARSLVLDGNGWVDVPINAVNPFDGSGDFSIVAWFKTSTTGAPVLISSARDNTEANHSMAVFANTDLNTYAVTYDNFFVGAVITNTTDLNDGQWHHYAVVYQATGNNFTVYLDGYPDSTASFDPNIPNISEDTVRIGNTLNTVFPAEVGPTGWVGNIDEIAVYNHALTPAEIKDVSKTWVNFVDFAVFAPHWLDIGCSEPDWCDCADLTADGVVDLNDLRAFADNWLPSRPLILLEIYPILLKIYSDGWGDLLETATMEQEGQITILVYEEEPYPSGGTMSAAWYYVYASGDGHYTEIYNCEASGSPPNNFITVDVDLDPIVQGKFNGTIFMTQWFFSDRYLPNTDVNVTDGWEVVTAFQTDEQGRFAIDLPPGNYVFEFTSDWGGEYHEEPVSIAGQYLDFFFPDYTQMLKPNIYLYPEETVELDVNIVFPHGGQITTSIPDYNDGWHITVEPSGIINGEYECLFYESLQPDYGQYAVGWVVIREELEDFFRNNMAQTGFNQKEIDDFIEYWIPRLTEYPYYAIYPQYNDELEEMVKLEFSVQPQSLIRLIYSVRGLEDNNLNIQEPVIPPFAREGFTVTEWGVILK